MSFKNRFPYISVIGEASDFKFGMQLRFAKAHHQNPGLGELPDICGFPFNISATAKASDFKYGTQLGFAKARHKITPRGKSGGGLGLGSSPTFLGSPIIFLQRLGLATSNLARSWALPRPIIKSHAEERLGVALC